MKLKDGGQFKFQALIIRCPPQYIILCPLTWNITYGQIVKFVILNISVFTTIHSPSYCGLLLSNGLEDTGRKLYVSSWSLRCPPHTPPLALGTTFFFFFLKVQAKNWIRRLDHFGVQSSTSLSTLSVVYYYSFRSYRKEKDRGLEHLDVHISLFFVLRWPCALHRTAKSSF